MSAPSRGRGGTTATRGMNTGSHGRSSTRGAASSSGRGRGKGRGGANTAVTSTNNAGGLLQKLRSESVQRNTDDGSSNGTGGRGSTTRGQSRRGRGNDSKPFSTTRPARSTSSPRPSSPALPVSHRDFMSQMNEKFQALKPKRDAERRKAISDGFLADPDKKTSLANAITPVGTCTDMCPQFERVERIVQNMVDRAEKVSNLATGRDMPSEERMVKRFRRSAAGYDEQLPSDIRTPEALRQTLDYLLDKVVGGGERLATIHKFVWDRTRGIRNDFSIQQVTKKEDVKIAVECYERIARFHVLSLHQLSNPDNLQEGEHFDAHQEREQLNNTLLSLMYYYDDNRGVIPLPNEPEFRSYCILFELQTLTPDLEDRMQAWPVDLLNHSKVQTAFRLYAAAANTILDQGPLRPNTPFSVAQSNSGKFWTILSSQAVSYIMACVAEMHFSVVRFTALDALWRSSKSSPQGQQARNQEWTLLELQNYLAFDDEDETLEFCQAFDLAFKNNDNGEQCLDFTAVSTSVLDKTSVPSQQIFSHSIVEQKRYRRTLVAVINGVGVATAIRQGLMVESSSDGEDEERRQQDAFAEDQSMFIPEQSSVSNVSSSTFGFGLNPSAASFVPSAGFGDTEKASYMQPSIFSAKSQSSLVSPSSVSQENKGLTSDPAVKLPVQSPKSTSAFGFPNQSPFGQLNTSQSASAPIIEAKPSSPFSTSISGPNSQHVQSSKSSPDPFGASDKVPSVQQLFPFNSTIFSKPAEQRQSHEVLQPLAQNSSGNQQPPKLQTEIQVPDAQPSAAGSGFAFNQPVLPTPVQPSQQLAPAFTSIPAYQPPAKQEQTSTFTFTQPAQTPQVSEVSQSGGTKSSIKPGSSIFTQPNKASSAEPSFSFVPQSSKQYKPTTQVPGQIQKPFSSPASETSTTPQGTPKRSQLGSFNFPPIANKPAEENHPSTHSSPSPTNSGPQTVAPIAPPDHAIHPTAPTPASPQQPVRPKFTEADRAKLVANTSRLILTQPQGLIEYFVSHHVSNILQTLVKQHLQEQHDLIITYVRTRHLSRKFFTIWRENAQRNKLNKRAKQRRKLLAAAMQAEQEKKRRDEAELEAILVATQETKRIQDEQRQWRQVESDTARTRTKESQQVPVQSIASPVVGQKRKTISTNDGLRVSSGTMQHVWPSHKRSRTVGTMSEPSSSLRNSTSSSNPRSSTFGINGSKFGQSFLGRSTSSADLRKSTQQRVDATKTDYFKLKAMGIDPNTPLVPETTKSLEEKKSKMQEDREALLNRSKIRPSALSMSKMSKPASPTVLPRTQPARASSLQGSPLQSSQSSVKGQPSMRPNEEDEFLRELRRAQQSLAHDADWFKNQTAALEKEIEQQGELRRSQNSQSSSKHNSPRVTSNGLAQVNGYEYYPIGAGPTKQLSRTEERIRRTGAHGLATRPIGRDYTPVAMSRHSALRYSYGASEEASTTKKHSRSSHDPVGSDRQSLESGIVTSSLPVTKRTREITSLSKSKSTVSLAKAASNAFATLQNHDFEEDEEQEDEEEEPEGESNYQSTYYHRNGIDGDTEDNDDEDENDDLFEEDEDDIANADGEDGAEAYAAHHYALLSNIPNEERVYDEEDEGDEDEEDDDDGTPGTYPHFSRAQSGASSGMMSQVGPGASADDALVLSD